MKFLAERARNMMPKVTRSSYIPAAGIKNSIVTFSRAILARAIKKSFDSRMPASRPVPTAIMPRMRLSIANTSPSFKLLIPINR